MHGAIMIYAIGTDHRGFAHKEYITTMLSHIEWLDVGAYNDERSDYPIFAQKVCESIRDGNAVGGILICGSGIGMSIVANRYPLIYAGLAWNAEVAMLAKAHDAVNVLIIPSDYVSVEMAVEMICAWQEAEFKGGRYQERITMIDDIRI